MQKYGFDEARAVLERASARETAARVALAIPSHSVRPGSLRWTWVSVSAGISTSSPRSIPSP